MELLSNLQRTRSRSAPGVNVESEDGVGRSCALDYDSADPEENGSHSEGVEEEEEAEQYSDEEAPAAAPEPKHPAADNPAQGGWRRGRRRREEERMKRRRQKERGEEEGESTDDPETKAGGETWSELDDDEDRKNPPTSPERQEQEAVEGRGSLGEHDKFRRKEQAPKSREELIAIYGYDIRNGGGGPETAVQTAQAQTECVPQQRQEVEDGGGGGGGERPVRSAERRRSEPRSSFTFTIQPSTSHSSVPLSSAQRSSNPPDCPLPQQNSHQNRNNESNTPQMHPRERQGPKLSWSPQETGVWSVGGAWRRVEGRSLCDRWDITVNQGGLEQDQNLGAATTTARRSRAVTSLFHRGDSSRNNEAAPTDLGLDWLPPPPPLTPPSSQR
ncbi:hypothetical protein INR49_006576 [Caranx melampygus]|nr:hypothetical protein INR49_006576 [Caranx melampygus]